MQAVLAVLLCFAEIFKVRCVEEYKKFNGVDFSLTKARTKVLASFEAGMNLPNLQWQIIITSLKNRSLFGKVPCFRQITHQIMA